MELSRGPSSATSSDEVMNGQRALGNAPPFHQNNHAHAHNQSQSHSHSHAHAHAQQQQQQQALHHRIFRPEISTQRCPDAVRKAAAITASSAKPSMPADAFERFQQQQQQSREFRNPSLYAAVNGNGRHRHRHRHDDDDEEEDDDDEEEDDASDDEDDGGGDDDDGGMDGMVAPSSNSGAGENVLDVFQKTPNLGVMKQGHHHPSLGMFLSPPFLNTFSQGGHAGMLGEPSQNGAAVAAYFKGATAAPRMPGAQDGAMAAAAAAESDNYYTQLLQSGGPLSHKDPDVDDASASAAGGPFAADRKVSGGAGSTSSDTPEISLRGILSDPITGALMDDASILLTCGHSFGSVTIQNCLEMRSCATCGQSISSDSVAPNHSLRAAVQAYRREDEFQSMSSKSSKRRREKYEQDKSSYSDSMSLDCARGKGVQFPFVVNDRVIIKGNKRTPERFVGREAVITTQCLNGWYVVKTLDNAESVKLQYRSLEKVGEHQPLNELSQKAIGPSWLVNN